MKKFLLLAFALLLIPAAYAAADVTYTFDQNNVSALVYTCQDSSCQTVNAFPGSITKGPTVTDGKITIRYPDTLASPYGYVEFFTSSGYVPLVGKHTWHTYGQPGIATTSESNTFSKLPNACKATVSDLSL